RKTVQQLAGDQKGHESPCKARAIRVGSEQMLHWPSQADRCSISRSEPTDVLALVQLGRLLDRTLVYDRGQVVLVLHLGLRLRLENEVGPVDLVRFGIDRRFTEDGLALEVLKRLDRLLWLCTVGELNPGKDGMRHAVSRCWRVSGRNAAALLPVGLDEGLVFGIVDRPVVIGADLEIFAHFRIE